MPLCLSSVLRNDHQICKGKQWIEHIHSIDISNTGLQFGCDGWPVRLPPAMSPETEPQEPPDLSPILQIDPQEMAPCDALQDLEQQPSTANPIESQAPASAEPAPLPDIEHAEPLPQIPDTELSEASPSSTPELLLSTPVDMELLPMDELDTSDLLEETPIAPSVPEQQPTGGNTENHSRSPSLPKIPIIPVIPIIPDLGKGDDDDDFVSEGKDQDGAIDATVPEPENAPAVITISKAPASRESEINEENLTPGESGIDGDKSTPGEPTSVPSLISPARPVVTSPRFFMNNTTPPDLPSRDTSTSRKYQVIGALVGGAIFVIALSVIAYMLLQSPIPPQKPRCSHKCLGLSSCVLCPECSTSEPIHWQSEFESFKMRK